MQKTLKKNMAKITAVGCLRKSGRPLLACVFAFAFGAASAQAEGDDADDDESPFVWSLDGTGSYDTNVGRAQFTRDVIGEYQGAVELGLAYDFDLGLFQALSARGFAETQVHQTLKPLDQVSYGGELSYRFQFALGFYEPFITLSLRAQDDDVQDDMRDAGTTTFALQASRRLSDSFTGTLGIERRQTDSDSRVFDVDTDRAFINLDYRMEQGWVGFLTLGYLRGQTVSSAQLALCDGTRPQDIFPLLAASQVIEPDQAFNEALCGDWLSYRLEANTKTLQFGLNKSVSHALALDLSVLWVDTEAALDAQVNYQRRIARVGLLMRF